MLRYQLARGDTVTTVSLQFGVIIEMEGDTLTIERKDHSIYYASVNAVIRVSRNDETYVVERRQTYSRLHPYETSYAQREFIGYMVNRYDRLPQDRSAARNAVAGFDES